jgi:alpha-glucoside transport system substrate-binding protein
MFKSPPGCLFVHHGTYITDFFQKQGGAKPTDYNFFPFPVLNPQYAGAVTGAGAVFVVFHDTPQARSLIQYLVTAGAQQIWVNRGGSLSGNTKVTTYPDPVLQHAASILANSKIFRFSQDDLMPPAMESAFWKAVLDATKDPTKLSSILAGLDQVQRSAYAS